MTYRDMMFSLTLAVVVGFVTVAGLVWFLKRKTGRGADLRATRLAEQRRLHPALARLPEAEQLRIVNQATWLPLIFALLAILMFVVFVAYNSAVLDFINQSGRAAGFVGVILLVVILLPVLWLQRRLVRRALRKRGV
jgi:hypothetical protein